MNRLLSLAVLLALLTAANAYADGPWYDPYQQQRLAPLPPMPAYAPPVYRPVQPYTPPVFYTPPRSTTCQVITRPTYNGGSSSTVYCY